MKAFNKLALACIIGTSTLLTACGGDKSAEQKTDSSQNTSTTASDKLETKFVTIGTGGASGPYNIIGTSLAEGYASQFGANAKTQTTGASVENLNLLDQKKLEMAFVMSDALNEAVSGTGNFKAPLTSVSQIATLYPNYVQIVASQASGIKSIEDLRGKRIAVGAQGSGVEVATRALLEGFGITYNDVKVDYLGYVEAADGLKSGKLDAAFLTSGLPNSSLMELEQGFKLQMVAVPADKLAEIAKTKTYFVPMNIPKGTYSNTEDVPTAAILNTLVVRSDLSENDVYLLTKSLFENLPALQNAHQAAKDIDIAKAQTGLVAPLHAGAKRYYDEMGAATANEPISGDTVQTTESEATTETVKTTIEEKK
ncbi:TAXI family TRAP transporter solute-binding subunit [Moraxella bovis]|uniref:TAXI family TRAP transporter solute-binding subunit n=1 Tax=Moraxella bovis TaxID=476 RepID=UPI002226B9C3|nr:TAXI family TRAP transporter solute-binding subunit [Moraxella bovis]UYZ69126.1 TAXI family TRAP transporter solute-binding subunit [Moraxella bovis]UYZ71499.1 TAXI family TRAP transporter solute-binding subunit [Moraxella bovis]UYZ72587.1 TAXI family TRAP transporter solute-binding subunit [Moraxella bovis]UYZ88777.1 TAXI family TRAP transporter solute-binding subunit [Moraxella bovis]UZA14794.1 TAXI family TRAP transporter solute-binding subunit [Moraxella bovis]